MVAAAAKLALVVVLCLVTLGEAGINCQNVEMAITPCLNYLTGKGVLTTKCCQGVKSINNAAKNTDDRRTTCRCLRQAAASSMAAGLKPANVQSLPNKCHVPLSFKISTSTNCATVP